MASKAVKKVIRITKKSGGTRGEAMGVVGNLRHGNTLKPKAQIKRSVRIAKDEGLSRARVQKLKTAERQIVRTAVKRQASSIGGKPMRKPVAPKPGVSPTRAAGARTQKAGPKRQLGFKPGK